MIVKQPIRRPIIDLVFLLCFVFTYACTSVRSSQVLIDIEQQVGGSFVAACITEDSIHLKKHFTYISLQYRNHRLYVEQQSSPLTLKASQGRQTHSTKPISLQIASSRQSNPCQSEAWISLSAQSRLDMKWHGKQLVITAKQWTWGNESRRQFTGLQDIVPMTLTSNDSDRRYVIATQSGLWTWKAGQSHAHHEYLPSHIPKNIKFISKDGPAWWLSTPQDSGYVAWPLSLFNGPAKVIGTTQSRQGKDQNLLVPISGKALRAQKNKLSYTWSTHTYSTAPIKDVCVLNSRYIILATSRGISILRGPSPRAAQVDDSRLQVVKEIVLPTSTTATLCEPDHLILGGLGYGLISMKIHVDSPPKTSK